MYHVTKNNNIAKELNFFLEVRSVTLVKNSDTLPIMSFETQQDWEVWLNENHTETSRNVRATPKTTSIISKYE